MAKDTWGLIGVAAIVVLGLALFGVIKLPTASTTGVPITSSGDTSVISAGCNVAPAMTYSVADKYTSTVKATVATTYIKVNNNAPVSAYATAAGGDVIEYLPYNTTLFVAPIKQTIGCGATTMQATSVDNTTGGHTFNIFNDEGNVMTNGGGATNITLGAGASKAVTLDLTAPSREALGVFGGVFCVEVSDNTVLDPSKTKFVGEYASKPKIVPNAATGAEMNCIKDTTVLANSANINKKLTVAAMPGQNPGVSNYVNVYYVPYKYFKEIDGTFKLGTEDSDGTNYVWYLKSQFYTI